MAIRGITAEYTCFMNDDIYLAFWLPVAFKALRF